MPSGGVVFRGNSVHSFGNLEDLGEILVREARDSVAEVSFFEIVGGFLRTILRMRDCTVDMIIKDVRSDQ